MEEIIDSMPWACGDSDCPVGWHLANYWQNEDGSYTVDNYSDGDHEEIDRLPSRADFASAWLTYWESALETGEDPLHQVLGTTKTVETSWCVEVNNSIVGPILCGARRATRDTSSKTTGYHVRGPWMHGSDIPEEVARFCLFAPFPSPGGWRIDEEFRHFKHGSDGFRRYWDLVQSSDRTSVQGCYRFFFTISEKVQIPPSPSKIRRAARIYVSEYGRHV